MDTGLADAHKIDPTGKLHVDSITIIFGSSANPPELTGVCSVMDTNLLDLKFARIGARLRVADRPSRRMRRSGPRSVMEFLLDVQSDRRGEFFEIVRPPAFDAEIAVLDVQPFDRHLLILVRENGEKQKFLCGHDERHWFVAVIPEKAPVGTVRQAKEALKPAEVKWSPKTGPPIKL